MAFNYHPRAVTNLELAATGDPLGGDVIQLDDVTVLLYEWASREHRVIVHNVEAANTVLVEVSADNSNWFTKTTITGPSTYSETEVFAPVWPYCRVTHSAGASALGRVSVLSHRSEDRRQG